MTNPVVVWLARLDSTTTEIHPISLPENIAGLDAVTARLPGGAYTTIRTYHGNQVIRLQDQVVRLEQSARLAGKPVLLDEARFRGALRSALAQARKQLVNVLTDAGEIADLRLRLTLDLESQPGDLYIAIELLEVPPQEAYQEGVAIVTCTLERLQPEAKLTRFIARSQHIRQSLSPGVNEAVMVSAQGFLLEGLTSNFFAVSHDEIRTAGEAVLVGITRGLVLDSARRLGLSVRFQPVHISELSTLQEAFITSSSRGILPVCRIDELRIGAGNPGQLTRRLMYTFDEIILEQLEPLNH
jgi:branched-chain amino acid aminotransferase